MLPILRDFLTVPIHNGSAVVNANISYLIGVSMC